MNFHYASLEIFHKSTGVVVLTDGLRVRIDRFDFAMPISRENGRLVMHCMKT